MNLVDAANYIRTAKAPAGLLAFVGTIKRIFTFTQERANRLARYIAVTRAYKNGQPVKDIQNKFGCSPQTVLRYARLADLPKRLKHLPREIREAVLKDYKNPKLSVAQIAKLHGVSPTYVSNAANEAGISRYEARPVRGQRRSPREERARARAKRELHP